MKFKIGDKVVASIPHYLGARDGTIVGIEDSLDSKNPLYMVEFSDGIVVRVVPERYLSLEVSASNILKEASDCIVNRAVERDKEGGERSMDACVKAFNALTGHTLTEEQGNIFMVVLKAARSQGGAFKLDDYVDGASYFALAGEAAKIERGSK